MSVDSSAAPLGAKVAEEAVAAAENRNQCPTGWFQLGSHCFKYIENARTWPLAERHYVSLGANLVSVHSSAEDQFLQVVVGCKAGGFSPTWIGGFYAVQDRLWFWSDGSKFDYQNWKKGEPNNSGGREPCMVMNWGGTVGPLSFTDTFIKLNFIHSTFNK
ncbi:unnamed protein product [Coregonus sp. 'balchen']|nr:unnamed protein product [Coregonus sp. 'balchen']